MGYKQSDVDRIKQKVRQGEERITTQLDGANTTQTIRFGSPPEAISYQRTGSDLTATVEVSINGVDFVAATAIASSAINTYNASLIKCVRITRTGGSGKVYVLGR